MEMEDDVRIVPVDIGSYSVILGADSLHYGILESQGCEMAVSDPPAVAYGLSDSKGLVRIDPVFPGQGHRVVIEIIGGLESVISVDQDQQSGCASGPHAETVCRLQVCRELHASGTCDYILASGLTDFFLYKVILIGGS